MGIGPGIQVLADLANVVAVGVEFQKLCGRCHIGRPVRAATTRKYEHMAVRIHPDTSDLTEMDIGWQFQGIGNGFKGKFRYVLCER